jgi:hypothetical protein
MEGDAMKPIHWLTAVVVLLLLSPSLAQAADTDITDVRVTPALDMDQMKYILSHQREEIFQRGMALESKQWKVFWKVYDEFDKEKGQLDAKRLLLLGTFVSKNATLTGEEATKLIKASGENQQQDLALRQKYFEILSTQLNPVAAARFAQLDDIIGMVTRLAILGNAPLISGVSGAAEESASSPEPANSMQPAGSQEPATTAAPQQ